MGLLKRQEVRLTIRYLIWKYQKSSIPIPDTQELERRAEMIVDEAHRIARIRGRNVISIVKELIDDLKKD